MQIIGFILAPLFTFFLDFLLKIFNMFSKAPWFIFSLRFYIPFIIAITTFILAFIGLLLKVYKFIMYFFDLINNYIANTGSEIVNVGFSVLKSVGFFEALSDSTAVFLPIVFSFISLNALKIIMTISREKKDIVDELTNKLYSGDSKSGRNRFGKGKK